MVELPDGARVRGRALHGRDALDPAPEWSLFLLGRPPADPGWAHRWVRWRDFRLPADADDARSAFSEAHRLAAVGVRVEIACGGGRGRTGTALACLAQIGGVGPDDAVAWVRRSYDPRAIETPWQRRYVRRFRP